MDLKIPNLVPPLCIFCGVSDLESLLEIHEVPVHPVSPQNLNQIGKLFGQLDIVRCLNCSHVFNKSFVCEEVNDLYSAAYLTNVPVSKSMLDSLDNTAKYILSWGSIDPVVADIGGGTGGLARALAKKSREVHLVEPSNGVDAVDFEGTNIKLYQAMFPAKEIENIVFDLIVSRQVIEHIPDPLKFLKTIRSQLNDDGIVYIECPALDYIERAGSIIDFHYPHVHYFSKNILYFLFSRAGFRIIDRIELKDGHDHGYILSKNSLAEIPLENLEHQFGIREVLSERQRFGANRLKKFHGNPIMLYGANAYSQAFLALYSDICDVAYIVDDNATYSDRYAYSKNQKNIHIKRPEKQLFDNIAAVIITSYMHDIDILRKIRAFEYDGPIFTVRSDGNSGNGSYPDSFFK